MSTNSSIEWTDATWNPVRGCVKVSPGCAHCYAETFAERFRGVKGHPYEQGFDLQLVPEKLTEPLSWKKPRRVFVNSMSDLFQEGVPDEYIDQVFAVMALCQQHTFQVLTKRAERMLAYLTTDDEFCASPLMRVEAAACEWSAEQADLIYKRWPLPNVWLGVSAENQHFAEQRIPLLLQTPAAVRFISAEPLLGPIDLRSPVLEADSDGYLDWVIVGGESGPRSRPFNIEWARSIVEQCRIAGVACFVKQLGANTVDQFGMMPITDRKGGNPDEWPSDLRVREFPTVVT